VKIALISPGLHPYVLGGIQRHSFNLARELVKLGVGIDLYHTDFSTAEGIDGLDGMTEEERAGITSIAVPWPKGDRLPGHFIRELRKFSASVLEAMRERPAVDLIYDQGMTSHAILEARKRDRSTPPVLVNMHGYEMFQPTGNLRSKTQNLITRGAYGDHVRRADHVVSLGGKLTDLIRDKVKVAPERIVVMPNGVDCSWLSETPSASSGKLRMIFVGRFERRKGIKELHEAIRANPHWENVTNFRFVGPIPENKRLRLPNVSYAGAVSDELQLKAEYRNGDVLICPSHAEGMPTVILEAMASGLAVIATDVGATNTMVLPPNGILLEGPEPDHISMAIDRMLELEPEALQAMKRASLKAVERFRWDRIAMGVLEELRGMIAAR
jgi:glycosyltransferase involved in cell wall biosynthesis